MKTKSILSSHMVMLPVIFIAFAGYFLSLYRGNTSFASNYSLLIIVTVNKFKRTGVLRVT